jgi:uncharacterized protein (TIGR02246 family)
MYRALPFGESNSGPSQGSDAAIRGLTQDFCTAFNTGNYDHAAALFRHDAQFISPHREPSEGTKAIERTLREFGDNGYEDLRLETASIDSSADIAVETGHYSFRIRRGTGLVTDHGRYLRTWRRLGAWLITADCWSSSVPLRDAVLPEADKVA